MNSSVFEPCAGEAAYTHLLSLAAEWVIWFRNRLLHRSVWLVMQCCE